MSVKTYKFYLLYHVNCQTYMDENIQTKIFAFMGMWMSMCLFGATCKVTRIDIWHGINKLTSNMPPNHSLLHHILTYDKMRNVISMILPWSKFSVWSFTRFSFPFSVYRETDISYSAIIINILLYKF